MFLKLRNNISMEGDIQLARIEVTHMFNKVEDINRSTMPEEISFPTKEHILSFARSFELIGFNVAKPNWGLRECIIYLSFIQEIWFKDGEIEAYEAPYIKKMNGGFCAIPLMAMSEFLSYSGTPNKDTAIHLINALTLSDINKKIEKIILKRITSAPHVHSLHAYKAKFFPRFVRALIVANLNFDSETTIVCDPYLGSGTTLVECSLMGLNSYGIDIDPLSCLISKIKLDAMDMREEDLLFNSFFQHLAYKSNTIYEFPDAIKKKFVKWNTIDEMEAYQREISSELDLIKADSQDYQKIHKIALSDALTRKFNIRMMGTGSGRFALDIAKTPLKSIIKSNLSSSIKAVGSINCLRELYNINLGQAHVSIGNATNRDFTDNLFDIIVTSPPYLPASSGREDYLTGKMISIKAMELASDNEMSDVKNSSVGSMENNSRLDMMHLPESVIDLFNWLMVDNLRRIKAAPIVTYYNALRDSLYEDMRTLKEGGKLIYIIGKESVFYSMSTKEILYKVECDKIFTELAISVGLKLIKQIDIELDKKSAVARPRSTDKYYECAIILTK